eukprot:GHVO01039459.1.p2 GENE.GHVO01039459.1~~GHVO01039459.1.p2  ORF type:complete len:120 (+),score=24.53 GHVO01039459.1:260-619(+)
MAVLLRQWVARARQCHRLENRTSLTPCLAHHPIYKPPSPFTIQSSLELSLEPALPHPAYHTPPHTHCHTTPYTLSRTPHIYGITHHPHAPYHNQTKPTRMMEVDEKSKKVDEIMNIENK